MRPAVTVLASASLLFSHPVVAFGEDIHLKNGNTISGHILSEDDKQVLMATEFSPPIAVLKSFIASIEGPSETKRAPEQEKDVAQTPAPCVTSCVLLTRHWDSWANIGFSFTGGNVQTSTLSGGSKTTWADGPNKLTFQVSNYWDVNRGLGQNISVEWGEARYQRSLHAGKWFAWVADEFERDPGKLLVIRTAPGAGLGYRLLQQKSTRMELYSGFDWNLEGYSTLPNSSSAEFVIGNTLQRQITARTQIEETYRIYLDLSSGTTPRQLLDATVTANMARQMFFYISGVNRYEPNPNTGVKSNDLLLLAGLRWAFFRRGE
jgi:Protein of unknown function, DUF481